MKKKSIIISFFIFAVLLVPLVFQFLEQYRPITKTDDWKATITSSDTVGSIDVFKMSGFPDRILVWLQEDETWFGVDEYGVNLIYGVKNFPCRHHNKDTPFGILLTDPKLEGKWSVEWKGENVTFGNSDFQIFLQKADD